MDSGGDVVSHLNISNVRVQDGGHYSCRAVNSLGSAEHGARLNIYGNVLFMHVGLLDLIYFIAGPPFIRPIGPVKAVAAADITLRCPYSGYPITSVHWER